MIDKENFGKRINECMQKKGKSNKEITEKLGLSKNIIGNCKKNQIPSAETLYELSQYLGTTTEYLLTGKELNDCTEIEKELLQAYQAASPEIKIAVNKLLDIQPAVESSTFKIG